MNRPTRPWRGRFASLSMAAVLAAVLALPAELSAQLALGSLVGVVSSDDGGALPGVIVTLVGRERSFRQRSDEDGKIRFLDLEPGNYKLRAIREGFQSADYPSVEILLGRATLVQIRMSRTPGETLVVTSEPPLLETSPEPLGIRITSYELDAIPTARDPWSVVAQAPGVILEAPNTGGNKANSQLAFVGPGASRAQNAFVLDGVEVTDLTAAGSSPISYDLDQLEEVRVTIGGPDAAAAQSGVLVDLVTKRGTDQWRGSGRYFLTHRNWQSTPDISFVPRPDPPTDLDPGEIPPPRGGPGTAVAFATAGNEGPARLAVGRILGVDDVGAEGGGLLWPERLWIWGSFGSVEARQTALGGDRESSLFNNSAIKGNAQLFPSNSMSLALHRSDKTRTGIGAGPTRELDAQQTQHARTSIWKLEDSQVLGSNLHVSLLVSRLDGGFRAEPNASPLAEPLLAADGVWRGSYAKNEVERDATQQQIEARSFSTLARTTHETRLGLSNRVFDSADQERWGPRDLIHIDGANTGTSYDIVRALRPGRIAVEQTSRSIWLQDDLRADRLTVTLGIRYDQQQGESGTTIAAANPAFPELLPATLVRGRGPDFRWRSFAPRLGASWALDDDRRSIVRASYSRFASQLNTTLVDRLNPLASASVSLGFEDADGDGLYDLGERNFLLSSQGVDPSNPSALGTPNQTDPGLKPELTDELTLAWERLVRPEVSFGIRATYREVHDILEARRLVRTPDGTVREATAEDYHLDRVLEGFFPFSGYYRVPIYSLDARYSPTGGQRLVNGDRRQEYQGLTFQVTRRLSGGWMFRGNATWNDWRWRVGREYSRFADPTDLALGSTEGRDGDRDGEIVTEPAPGSDLTFLSSRWSFNMNGLVQIAPSRPWGFQFAANLSGRQGYPIPYALRVTGSDGLVRTVQVTSRPDSVRHPDLFAVDARIEKEWTHGSTSGTVSLDFFNLLDRDTVVARERFVNLSQANAIRDTVGPRVFRLGFRIRWH